MNKTELTDFIAKQNSCSKAEAEKAINIFTNGIIGAVGEGNDVSLIGFGNFTINAVEARAGVNPKTKEQLRIEAYSQVRFKVGQKLKDAANGGKKDKPGEKHTVKAKDKDTKDKK